MNEQQVKQFSDSLPAGIPVTQDDVRVLAYVFANWAELHGVNVEIERRSTFPLAMRNHIAHVTTWAKQ